MSELLSAAATALGIPESLVERSAAARAAETGASAEDVLVAWAGGAPAPTATVPVSPEPTNEPSPPPVPESAPEQVEPAAAAVVVAPVTSGATTRAPIPDNVTPGEAARFPDVVTAPTAGLRERTNFVIPKWLAAVLIIAPLFALYALGGSATGECGSATELRTDVVTGEIVNCDGTPFTGQQIGGGGPDYVALGEQIYNGGVIAAVNCAGCHGPGGQGAGAFPALTGVLNTFSACSDHQEWVTLGSVGFQTDGRTTYGDTGKPVAGGMPSFASSLSAEQISAVVAFERVRFGGGDETSVLTDCGLTADQAGDATTGTTTAGGGAVEASNAHSG